MYRFGFKLLFNFVMPAGEPIFLAASLNMCDLLLLPGTE